MPTKIASVGWELEGSGIARIDIGEPHRLEGATAVCIAIDAVAAIWQRAVGSPTRSFRSTTHEQDAWRLLAAWNRQLRRHLRRDGLLIVRLEDAGPRCRVRMPPDDECFPPGSELNTYEALASVSPQMAALAAGVGRLTHSEMFTGCAEHPLETYLEEFAGNFSPRVAIVPRPEGAERLAQTSAGYCVALAWSQVAALPVTTELDPAEEGRVLGETVARWHARRHDLPADEPWHADEDMLRAAVDDLAVPGIDALRDREWEIARQIRLLQRRRELIRRQRAAREKLWDASAMITSDCREAVARLLDVLGLPLGTEQAPGVTLEGDVETLPSLLGQPTGQLLHGRLRIDASRERPVVFFAAPPSAGNADERGASGGLLAERAARQGAALVPVADLYQAASVVLMSDAAEPTAARVRRALLECVGQYRFDLAQVIDPAERAELSGRVV